MKTLTTLAATLLAVFLTLAPTVAFAATTVTVATDAASYSGAATIHVTGTVSPAPSASTAVFITTRGPQGVVDYGTAAVSTASGAYSYTYVAGGGSNWASGTYTVNASWGASSGATPAFATTTFQYTASTISSSGGGGASPFTVRVIAPSLGYPGETLSIFIETTWNGNLVGSSTQAVSFHAHVWLPNGNSATYRALQSPSNFAKGHYITSWTVPSNETLGNVEWVHVPATYAGLNATGVAGITIVPKSLLDGSLASNQQNIMSTLGTMQSSIESSLSSVTSAANDAKTAAGNTLNAVNGLASTVNGIQSTVNGINSDVMGLSSLSGLSAQMSSLSSAVSNSQTYVLVVAALAAITLVLELAILVRKLS